MAVALLRSTSHLPRSDSRAGIASTRAAMPTRAITADSADQPASMSERAKVPEVAKVTAESSANPTPAAGRECMSRSSGWHRVMSKLSLY